MVMETYLNLFKNSCGLFSSNNSKAYEEFLFFQLMEIFIYNYKLLVNNYKPNVNSMKINRTKTRILKILLKDFTVKPTITALAAEIGMSRIGMWKAIRLLETEKLITLSPVGTGKTSVFNIGLNWETPILEKILAIALTEDAIKNQRWLSFFKDIENKVEFLIIYGSVIKSQKEADDIDILSVSNKFIDIDEVIKKIQKTQIKKIHSLVFTQKELKDELEKPNKAFVGAIKNGIILFGQEKFIEFIKRVKNNEGKRSNLML